MKFTLFVLLAGLCLVAAATNVELPDSNEDFDYQYIPSDVADDITQDIEAESAWFGLFFVITKVLTTLKGINCSIKEVIQIRAAAQTFVSDLKSCGGEVSKKVQQLINTCNNIISTCNDIIHAKTKVCGDTDSIAGAAAALQNRTPFKCFWNLLFKFMKLKYEIKKAINQISKIPSVPGETGKCVKNASDTLANVFKQFPSNVKTCSKLVS